MTTLKLSNFTGMVPRVPDDRLPPGAAKDCTNCDFRYGELRPIGGPGAILSTSVTPVRGLFSDNGERFFVWDKPTRAYLGPTVDDTFDRVYYQNDDGFRVAQRSNMRAKNNNPGPPTESWVVGVPRPSWAPKTYRVPANSWNGNTNILVRIFAYWSVAGAKVSQSEPLTIASVPSPWYQYYVDPANIAALSPLNAGTEPIDGWVYGDTQITVISTNNDSVTRSAGEWRINISGQIQIRLTNDFQQLEPVFGDVVLSADGGFPIGAIIRKNTTWYQLSPMLYHRLRNAQIIGNAPSDGYLAFELEVVDTRDDLVIFTARAEYTGITIDDEYVIEPYWPDTLKETISYVVTFENLAREESAPSDPTVLDVYPFHDVHFYQATSTGILPGGVPLVGINVYRTYPGNNTEYILVNEHPIDWVVTWEGEPHWFIWDDSHAPKTSTTLQSAEWEPPPANLKNLTYVGNGFFAGSVGKDLLFSEPYRGHTWPYRMTFPHEVMGVIAVEGGVLVTTNDLPYLVLGATPDSMSQQAIQVSQAGVSSHSLARVGNAAIYLSNDGFVSLSGGQPSIQASQQLFTRQDWRGTYGAALSVIQTVEHDDIFFCIVPASHQTAEAKPFAVRMDADGGHMTHLDFGAVYSAARVGTTDALYLGLATGLAEFWPTGSSYASMTWHSGDLRFPRPVFFGAGKVVCDGTVTVEAFCGGVSVTTQVCSGTAFFRMPSVSPQEVWSFRVTGTGVLRFMEFGPSYAALKEA